MTSLNWCQQSERNRTKFFFFWFIKICVCIIFYISSWKGKRTRFLAIRFQVIAFLVILTDSTVHERESHPPQKRWWKSSFCTHCDDGDDDACNLQQQTTSTIPLSLPLSLITLLFHSLFPPFSPHIHGRISSSSHLSFSFSSPPIIVTPHER